MKQKETEKRCILYAICKKIRKSYERFGNFTNETFRP